MQDNKVLSKVKELTKTIAASGKLAPAGDAQDGPPWLSHVAVLTGVLAALTGFLTVRSTTLTNEAIYESNQAILSQTQASDAWAEYQANSIKAHIVEMQLLPSSPLSPADRADLTKMNKEIRDRQPVSRESATEKIKERQAHLDEGLKRLQQKDMLGYAGMVAQLGIALASVAALIRRRAIFYVGVVAGALSIAITAYVFVAAYVSSH
jgi:hypothetical protein